MQKICCVQHPQHSAAAAAQFVVAFNHVAFDVNAAEDRTRGISQRIDKPHTTMHAVVAQCRLTLAFERHANFNQAAVIVAKALVFAQKVPR